MHIGWVARLEPSRRTALAIRIQSQIQTRRGRELFGRESFVFDASSGERRELPFDPYLTLPVDLNGDGLHELVRGGAHDGGGSGEVLDGRGKVLGSVGGQTILISKVLDRPGEQTMTFTAEGTVHLWADLEAEDTDEAQARYASPFYRVNQRFSACPGNLKVLGGI